MQSTLDRAIYSRSPSILAPPSPQTTPTRRGESRVCVALGRNFGATLRKARPHPRPAPPHRPEAVERELSAGGGDVRKVASKFLPRATETRNFPKARPPEVSCPGGAKEKEDILIPGRYLKTTISKKSRWESLLFSLGDLSISLASACSF